MKEMTTWTGFCSWPETPRGSYDEEIDVKAGWYESPTKVKRMIEAELANGYDKRLKVRRVVRRGPGLFF